LLAIVRGFPPLACGRPEIACDHGFCLGMTTSGSDHCKGKLVIHSYTYEFEFLSKELIAILRRVLPSDFTFTTVQVLLNPREVHPH
jgi:hypothetical protein